MTPEVLKLASVYGPLGLIALAFAWWIFRLDAAARTDRETAAAALKASQDDCRQERNQDRAEWTGKLDKLGEHITGNSEAMAQNTRAIERLSDRLGPAVRAVGALLFALSLGACASQLKTSDLAASLASTATSRSSGAAATASDTTAGPVRIRTRTSTRHMDATPSRPAETLTTSVRTELRGVVETRKASETATTTTTAAASTSTIATHDRATVARPLWPYLLALLSLGAAGFLAWRFVPGARAAVSFVRSLL